MKSNKITIIAIVAIIVAVVSVGSVSAGLFDFLGGNSTDNSLDGQEVNLAAAASLKNVFDDKLIPMFEYLRFRASELLPEISGKARILKI